MFSNNLVILSTSLFTPTGSAEAPVPVARLIDADVYDGTNPDVLVGAGTGLAEYTNGNFFSGDTVFFDRDALAGGIPFPGRGSVEAYDDELPSGMKRRYFVKVRDGETAQGAGYRLAVLSALEGFVRDDGKKSVMGLDPAVHADYASFLVPRAVGYTAALLDYFFRGRLEVQVDGQRVAIVNATPGETMDGSFTLYYDGEAGARSPLATWSLVLRPGEASQPLESAAVPETLPATAPCLLVFRGVLVSASGAAEPDVAAGRSSACPRVASNPPPPSDPPPPGPGPSPGGTPGVCPDARETLWAYHLETSFGGYDGMICAFDAGDALARLTRNCFLCTATVYGPA